MTTGTASLLWGVHQFILHPVMVALAWRRLYGRWPTWREWICIVLHDIGYLGKAEMDSADGERHVELGAKIAGRLFGPEYYFLCLFHSRHYARRHGQPPSNLCWADKGSILYERWWTYLPRAWLSGELAQYRASAAAAGLLPLSFSHRAWFWWIQEKFRRLATARDSTVVPWVNPERQT